MSKEVDRGDCLDIWRRLGELAGHIEDIICDIDDIENSDHDSVLCAARRMLEGMTETSGMLCDHFVHEGLVSREDAGYVDEEVK